MRAGYQRSSTPRSAHAARLDAAPAIAANDAAPPLATFASAGYATGAAARPNRIAIGLVVLAHAAILFALVDLDVIDVRKPNRPPPTVITLLPETPPPPPLATAPPPVAEIMAPLPPKPALVVPPAIVRAPAPPPPIATVQAAAPGPATVAISPTETGAGPPAPITPPDFLADQLNNPPPKYPVLSRRAREEGTVRIRVMVSAEGGVQDIRLLQSSGYERLDKAALDAVRRWRFTPARQAGRAVAAAVNIPIPFRLT